MTENDPITRREFDHRNAEVDRRLGGHDELYDRLNGVTTELGRFQEALKSLREFLEDEHEGREQCQLRCKESRTDYERRLRSLERWQWKAVGIMTAVVGVPSIGTFILLVVRYAGGGLQ